MVLDQFKEGLKLLGGLDQIIAYPKLYEKLFVAVNEYDATDVLDQISSANPDGNNHLVSYYERYVSGKGSEDLRKFIIFCYGEYVLSTKPIKVEFYFREGFFVSTCSLKLSRFSISRLFSHKATFFVAEIFDNGKYKEHATNKIRSSRSEVFCK